MGLLDGRVALVTGADGGCRESVARALSAAGAIVRAVDGDLHVAGVAMAAVEAAAEKLGGVDVVVHAATDERGGPPAPLVDVDGERWRTVWENGMRASVLVAQAAHRVLAGRDGRLVFVIPTIALSGAAGHAALAARSEGQRLLAKSAARQWGRDGITVNCVAVAPDDLGGGRVRTGGDRETSGPAPLSLAPPALGSPPVGGSRLDGAVVFLASAASRDLTGATLSVDGGVWMTP